MKNRSGFTVIELLISIAIIGVLLAISILTFSKQQVEARDQTRYSRSTILAEAIEKYYEEHGEYPSVPSLVSESGVSGSAVAAKLNVEIGTIVFPGVGSSTTNSLTSGSPTSTKAKYTASSVNSTENTACQTSATGGCDSFTITYKKEADNTDVVISSRYTDRSAVVTPPPPPPPPAPDAPSAPTIAATYASNTVTGTASIVTCTGGNTAQYALSSRTNDGTWGSYSAWSTTRTTTAAASQGVKYGFRAKAKCVSATSSSVDSPVSAEATYIHPIAAPAAPVVVASTSANITTWNWPATTCPSGTTARYQYEFAADWGYDSPWYGPYTGLLSRTWDTASQGYQYITRVQAHCYNANDTSDWSASGEDDYIRPVTPPGASTYSIARGAPNIVYVRATAPCDPSVSLYSRADVHTWDYPWEGTTAYGWYADSHGGTWVANNWNFYGSTIETGSVNNQTNLNSGSGWNIATDMRCRNATTGRQSTTTGRRESPRMNLP
ncbi:Fimbrial protein precursor [compost metagenome]